MSNSDFIMTAGTIYETSYKSGRGILSTKDVEGYPVITVQGGDINLFYFVGNTAPGSTATMVAQETNPLLDGTGYQITGRPSYLAYEVVSGSPVVTVSAGVITS